MKAVLIVAAHYQLGLYSAKHYPPSHGQQNIDHSGIADFAATCGSHKTKISRQRIILRPFIYRACAGRLYVILSSANYPRVLHRFNELESFARTEVSGVGQLCPADQ